MFNPVITLIIIAKWKKKYLSLTCLAESVVGGMFCIDRYYSLPSIYFRAGLTIIRVKVKGEPKELVGCCLLLLLIRMVNKGSKKFDLLDSIQQGLTSDPPTFQRSCLLGKPLWAGCSGFDPFFASLRAFPAECESFLNLLCNHSIDAWFHLR